MTTQTKTRIKNWSLILSAALAALGWALTTGAAAIDTRYVHATEFAQQRLVDSISNSVTNQKLDELLTRIEQIQCGPAIARGCR